MSQKRSLTLKIRRHHLQLVVRVLAVGFQPGGDVHQAAVWFVHLQDVVRPCLRRRPEQICQTDSSKIIIPKPTSSKHWLLHTDTFFRLGIKNLEPLIIVVFKGPRARSQGPSWFVHHCLKMTGPVKATWRSGSDTEAIGTFMTMKLSRLFSYTCHVDIQM